MDIKKEELNQQSSSSQQENNLVQKQDIDSLTLQLESLQKQYNMEKTLWNERTRIKEEELRTIKAQVAEREQIIKSEFKKKEDEINLLKQKILELEGKLSLEVTLSQEKIKAREDEIKELKAKFEQEENKLKEEIALLQFKSKTKDDEIKRLGDLIAQRERELNSQIQWKQQELLMERARLEEEIKKLYILLRDEEKRFLKEKEAKDKELSNLKSELSQKVIELQVKYTEEQKKAEKLSVRLEELQKEQLTHQIYLDGLLQQIEELKAENKTLRTAAYLPDNVAKLKFLDAQEEINKLTLKISSLQSQIEQEKSKREEELRQKEEEIITLKSQIEEQRKEIEKGSYEKILQLQREKELLEVKIGELQLEKEQEINLRQKLLQEKEEMYTYFIDDLARGFVHRIRNLLGVINGAVEICVGFLNENIEKFRPTKKILDKLFGKSKIYDATTKLFAQFKENFDVATQHVSEMMKTVDEFRELSKPIVLDRQNVNINDILHKISSSGAIKERAQKQNVQLVEELSNELPQVSCDSAKLEQVFEEIFVNSFDALPKGGTIRIQSLFEKENNTVEVRIIDNGIGIPETQIGKIFQPFFTTKSNRNGVGLPKIKRIIVLHNGTISVQSEKNKGTTVSIKIPVIDKNLSS